MRPEFTPENAPFFEDATAACRWIEGALSAAVKTPRDTWHQGPITYMTSPSMPVTKTIVWRGWDERTGALEFYTDTRSAKWEVLRANTALSALLYCPRRLIQLSIQGHAELSTGTNDDEKLFEGLGQHHRDAYQSMEPPGSAFHQQVPAPIKTIDPQLGAQHFGRVRLYFEAFDFVSLHRKGHQRLSGPSLFMPEKCTWVCP